MLFRSDRRLIALPGITAQLRYVDDFALFAGPTRTISKKKADRSELMILIENPDSLTWGDGGAAKSCYGSMNLILGQWAWALSNGCHHG